MFARAQTSLRRFGDGLYLVRRDAFWEPARSITCADSLRSRYGSCYRAAYEYQRPERHAGDHLQRPPRLRVLTIRECSPNLDIELPAAVPAEDELLLKSLKRPAIQTVRLDGSCDSEFSER